MAMFGAHTNYGTLSLTQYDVQQRFYLKLKHATIRYRSGY